DPNCVASQGVAQRVVIASDDQGRTWRVQSEPTWLPSDAKLFADDRDLWLWSRDTGQVAYSGDIGRTWILATAPGLAVPGDDRAWPDGGLLWVERADGWYVFDRLLGA